MIIDNITPATVCFLIPTAIMSQQDKKHKKIAINPAINVRKGTLVLLSKRTIAMSNIEVQIK